MKGKIERNWWEISGKLGGKLVVTQVTANAMQDKGKQAIP